MAGNASSPRLCISYRRCTPVVVSSVTPLICLRRVEYHFGSRLSVALMELNSSISSSLPGLREQARVLLGLGAQVQQQRGVAAVIEDHVGLSSPIRPLEDLVGVFPVVLQRLALHGEHRRALHGDRRGGMILRREDVARGPAHLRAERLQRLDEHRGLDRHVQGAGDARALERLASWRIPRGSP